MQGIVVEHNGYYGVFDVIAGKLIIPCSLTSVYSITKSGQTVYYMEFAGEQIEFSSYVASQKLFVPKAASAQNTENTNTEDINAENTNDSTNTDNTNTPNTNDNQSNNN